MEHISCCSFYIIVIIIIIIRCSHIVGKETVGLLLDEVHVVSVPGSGGLQHVFPSQHQDSQALMVDEL